MKNLIHLALILLLLQTPLALAEKSVDESDISGFSGRIESGVIYGSSNSRIFAVDVGGFAIEELDSKIDDYGKNHDNISFAVPAILYEINYAFRDDLLVYFGTAFFNDDRPGPSLGVEKLFANGSVLDISLFQNGFTFWENPYALNVEREITSTRSFGLNINLSEIIETNFFFNYIASVFNTNSDVSGHNYPLLRRKGSLHVIKSGYTIFLDDLQSMALTPSLTYAKNNCDGDALAYDQFGAELSFNYEKDNNSLTLSAGTRINKHDAVHPFFNKRLNTAFYSGELFYKKSNLGDSNWYMRIGGGVDVARSNVDFFEHVIFISGITVGYSFE